MTSRLQHVWQRSQGRPGVVRPCISVCRMSARTGYCEGCWRSLDEIAAWSVMDDAQKRRVWHALLAREAESGAPT